VPDAVHELEMAVGARHPDLAAGLAAEGLRQERRALRLVPRELTAEVIEATAWRLRFCLPAGSYATMVVRELPSIAAPAACCRWSRGVNLFQVSSFKFQVDGSTSSTEDHQAPAFRT